MKTDWATLKNPPRGHACYVCPLGLAEHVAGCGGKAGNLGRMLRLGLRVPPGLVVTDSAFQAFLDGQGLRELIETLCEGLDVRRPESCRSTAQAVRERITGAEVPAEIWDALQGTLAEIPTGATLIVRSSAVGEDTARASFAGQLDSFPGVDSTPALRAALLACWASYWSERSLFYQLSRGVRLRGMAVIIQEQVRSRFSGVLFTRNPDPSSTEADALVAEYCHGLGGDLVSGRLNPGRIVIARVDLRCRRVAGPEGGEGADLGGAPEDAQLRELARAGLVLEDRFGGPQDVEWTIGSDQKLYLVQSRPVTAAKDEKSAGRTVLWSNANINENFPEPVSPLLYSIAVDGYYHYFRNLGLAFGVAPGRVQATEHRLRHLIGVHGGRLYYHLTNIHAALRQAPYGDVLAELFDGFVGVDAAPRQPPGAAEIRRGRLRQFLELGRMAFRASRHFLSLPRRVEAFERAADEFARKTAPAHLERLPLPELLDRLREFLDIRFRRWLSASLADTAAMAGSGALKRLLGREFPAEDLSALHNGLLKGLPGIVSGELVTRLWELSREIRKDAPLARLFATGKAPEILAEIRLRSEFVEFESRLEAFLETWGFRCPGELMLTVASFQEEPAALVEVLKAYHAADGESPADLQRRQDESRRAETARVFRQLRGRRLWRWLPWPTRGWLFQRLLNWTHRAIALRERARLKQALLYSRCRRVALAIGDQLVPVGYLNDAREVFFLTYQELDDLLCGSAMFPYQVKDVVQMRKAGHAALSAMKPPDNIELSEGSYLPLYGPSEALPKPKLAVGHGAEMCGTGVCGGQVTGPAAVLKDVSELGLLTGGDVLVARQTDPGWGPVFFLIRGLVMERGGLLSHGAILAREYGIPTVVGVQDATCRIAPGQVLFVNGDQGIVRLAN